MRDVKRRMGGVTDLSLFFRVIECQGDIYNHDEKSCYEDAAPISLPIRYLPISLK